LDLDTATIDGVALVHIARRQLLHQLGLLRGRRHSQRDRVAAAPATGRPGAAAITGGGLPGRQEAKPPDERHGDHDGDEKGPRTTPGLLDHRSPLSVWLGNLVCAIVADKMAAGAPDGRHGTGTGFSFPPLIGRGTQLAVSGMLGLPTVLIAWNPRASAPSWPP
jgi:hypothetical protein